MSAIIAIDAGHGGRNRGARAPGGPVEADVTLDVASRACALLALGQLVAPVLIRQRDEDLTLDERGGIAERAGAAAVVSLHLNWSEDPTRHGPELYHHRGDTVGRALGSAVLDSLPTELSDHRIWISDRQHEGRVAAPGALAVTGAYDDRGLPCALVELMFLSSALDVAWLARPHSIDTLATVVYRGVESFAKGVHI